jgi:small subunit ribosomal protein S7
MPRRKRIITREVLPDPKFKSVVVNRFINGLLRRGKKSVAEKSFYKAIDIIEEKTKQNGLDVFLKALDNVKPVLEVKSRRVGGATYQVPVEVSQARRLALAIRWIIMYAQQRNDKTIHEKLAAEMIAASNKEGSSIKKREDTHKMAEANRAFAHFRW